MDRNSLTTNTVLIVPLHTSVHCQVSKPFSKFPSVETNLENIGKNKLCVKTVCVCVQGGGETCLLKM